MRFFPSQSQDPIFGLNEICWSPIRANLIYIFSPIISSQIRQFHTAALFVRSN